MVRKEEEDGRVVAKYDSLVSTSIDTFAEPIKHIIPTVQSESQVIPDRELNTFEAGPHLRGLSLAFLAGRRSLLGFCRFTLLLLLQPLLGCLLQLESFLLFKRFANQLELGNSWKYTKLNERDECVWLTSVFLYPQMRGRRYLYRDIEISTPSFIPSLFSKTISNFFLSVSTPSRKRICQVCSSALSLCQSLTRRS